ncbi:Uncharacterised protein [Shigella sonnei]|nr:Uncharacterised protein [Shigella sonnei]
MFFSSCSFLSTSIHDTWLFLESGISRLNLLIKISTFSEL